MKFWICFALALAAGSHLHAADALIPSTFAAHERILFQGDSITDGNRGRSSDPNHILGHGFVFIIAAKYGASFPEKNLTFINRGVSGNKVSDLAKRWQTEALDLNPDILSVLIGVNDTSVDIPTDVFEREYDALLASSRAGNPEIRFVLCEPFALPAGKKKEKYEAWLQKIHERQQVVARLASKYDAALVRFQRAFDDAFKRAPAEYWIWDGVHPTYSGHQIMADEWMRTVAAMRWK